MAEGNGEGGAGGGRTTTAAEWFNPGGGGRRAAEIWFDGGGVCAQNERGERRRADFADAVFSSRMADIPRRITFPDGVTVVAADNDFIDAMLPRARSFVLHRAESKWRNIVLAFALAAAVGWGAVQFALPAAAAAAAERFSPSFLALLTEQVYKQFARHENIRPTRLSENEQQRAQRIFAETTAAVCAESEAADCAEYDFRLRLHRMALGESETATEIPNAFALPDGLIVAADRTARILGDDELAAVFAHEIAHVRRRHGLRNFLQSSAAAWFAQLLLGDVSLLLSGGAAFLAAQRYSREFEREADCDAYDFLLARAMPENAVGAALQKMETDFDRQWKERRRKKYGDDDDADTVAGKTDDNNDDDDNGDNKKEYEEESLPGWLEWLSTHPATEARANPRQFCGERSARQ